MSKVVDIGETPIQQVTFKNEFPIALTTDQTDGYRKPMSVCVRQYVEGFKTDLENYSIGEEDTSISTDYYNSLLEKPDDLISSVFHFISRDNVKMLRDRTDTTFVTYVSGAGSKLKVLNVKGNAAITNEQVKSNLLVGDAQLACAHLMNQLVENFYTNGKKFVMAPQARTAFTDGFILAAAKLRKDRNMKKYMATDIVKSLNIGVQRKSYRASEYECYDQSLAVAIIINQYRNTKIKNAITKEICRKQIKRHMANGASKSLIEAYLTAIIETSGKESSDIDEMMENMVDMMQLRMDKNYMVSEYNKEPSLYGVNRRVLEGGSNDDYKLDSDASEMVKKLLTKGRLNRLN